MKKLHTLFAIAAIIFFGLIFAAFDTSSPPTRAEILPTVEFQPGHSIRHLFVAESDSNNVGDIPIAANRRTEIKTLLTVISEVRNKPPERFDVNLFTNNLTAFSGFGTDNQARAKI